MARYRRKRARYGRIKKLRRPRFKRGGIRVTG